MFVLVCLSGLVAFGSINGQFQLGFGTSAPSAPKVFDPNCKDTIDTCWKMPETNCKAPYEEWAKQYCPNRCGYCIGPSTPTPPCVDMLPNCASYEKSVCTDINYQSWAADNCRAFCRSSLCTAAQITELEARTTTIAPENCVDKVDCRQYGSNACSKQFEAWSRDNCPKHCRFCEGIPTPPPVCEDKIPNCNQYPSSTCTTADYKLWVDDNCKKTCGRCTAANAIPNVPPTPAPPGKRNRVGLRDARPKRQFHASHHHEVDCWDGNNSADRKCNTTTDGTVATQTTTPFRVTSESSGSEFLTIYHPHPITPEWDGKPEITVTVPVSTVTPSQNSSFNQTTPSSTFIVSVSTSTPSEKSTTISSVSPPTATSSETISSSSPPTASSSESISSASPPTATSSETISSASLPTATSSETISSVSLPTAASSETISSASPPTATSSETISSASPPTATSSETISSVSPPTATSSEMISSASPPTATSSETISSASPPTATTTSASPSTTTSNATTPSASPSTTTSSVTTSSATPSMTTSASTSTTTSVVKTPSASPSTTTSASSSTTSSVTRSTASLNATTPSTSLSTTASSTTTIKSASTTAPKVSTSTPTTTHRTTKPHVHTTHSPRTTPSQANTTTTTTTTTTKTTIPTTPTPTTTTTTPTGTTNTTATEAPCEDLKDCAIFGRDICLDDPTNNTYLPFAKKNCPLYCAFCKPTTYVCRDVNSQCPSYDDGALCTDPDYTQWVYENCMLYCHVYPCNGTIPTTSVF